MKITHKLILGFSVVTLLIIVFGYYAVNMSQRALQKAIGESAVSLAAGMLQNRDRGIHTKVEIFKEYAKEPRLHEVLIRSNWEFEGLDDARAYIAERDREWTSVPKEKTTPFMSGLLDNELSYELREKLDFYEDRYGYKVFGEVFVTNRYGANVAQSGKTTDYRQDDEEWWERAKRDGFYIRDVAYDESAGVNSTDAAIRIDDEDGNFLGVMKVVLNIDDALAVIKESMAVEKYKSIQYDLLTRGGEVIYTTEEGHDPMKYAHREFLERLNGEAGYFIMGTQNGDFYDSVYGDDAAFYTFTEYGGYDYEEFMAYARSNGHGDFAGLGWILVIEYDTNEVFAPVVRLKKFIGVVLGFITLIAIVMSYVLSRTISRPVERLRDAAAGLGEGDYDARIKIESRDEIGELAAAFNQMAERLKDAIMARDEEIQDRKSSEETVRHMAYHDHLTGLPNRGLFIERLEQVMQREAWHKRLAAVFFLDLDRFKVINDTLGHAAGDRLLVVVGERFKNCLREGDSVARLGGDEFAILLQDLARVEDIPMVIEKIFTTLREPILLKGEEVSVSTSIGVSVYPHDGEDADTLLKNADIAMYRAKSDGRNNFQLYTRSMASAAHEQLKMERKLDKAIERNDLILHYQPLLHLGTGEIVGSEALLRLKDEEDGLVPPMKFIPIAEETGQIVAISEWVLHAACKQNKEWQDAGFASMSVAVNISARMFKQKEFIEMVSTALEKTGLDAKHLELEITESVVMTDAEESIMKMYELKGIGVRLSIDDFGSGYSSLNYLKHMPIDMLKIDRSFVRDLTTDVDVRSIVTAIVRMAQSLGVEVLAEGVEDEAQLEFITTLKCDKIQGFFLSRPIPAEEYMQLLRNKQPFIINKKAV